MYQSARAHTSNEDAAADCYLHICERLSAKGFRKLLKFKPEGSASFTTWLRVVARNLCFDWHRMQSGRVRPFKTLQHLSSLEREVYKSRLVHGCSEEETRHRVESLCPGLAPAELSEIEERLQRSLSSRHQWILRMRRESAFDPQPELLSEDGEPLLTQIPDSRPNQEELLADQQTYEQLEQSLASLPARERLLVQLRFEHELSLEEIARLSGLRDAQRVHRALAAIFRKLRDEMTSGKSRGRVRVIGQVTRHAGLLLRQGDQSR